ncbi:MAG: addiction module protein [Rubritalea sp.]|uniref:addiction module protein n=1 Tax=Rubritalea sp. TaxID=2109375 RepID=UPI0032428DBE
MTTTERLETMENLWDSLSRSSDEVASPKWHEDVLTSRRKHIDSGNAKFYTLDQIKSHFSR